MASTLHNFLPQPTPADGGVSDMLHRWQSPLPAPTFPSGPVNPAAARVPASAPAGGGDAPAWLQMLPAMFALGAGIGGAPRVGTGGMQGFQRGQLLQEDLRRQRAAEALAQTQVEQRQQQIDQQADQMALDALNMAEAQRLQAEQRRQAAINTSVDNLRAQTFATKAEYDAAIRAHETMLTNAYQVRPNILRAMVPFNGPDVRAKAKASLDPMIREYGLDAVVQGQGVVEIDRDGDGVAERVPITKALELAGITLMRDPVSGEIVRPPKGTTPERVDELSELFKGVLAEWGAEGKNTSDPSVRGRAMEEARSRQLRLQRRFSATAPDDGIDQVAVRQAEVWKANQLARLEEDKRPGRPDIWGVATAGLTAEQAAAEERRIDASYQAMLRAAGAAGPQAPATPSAGGGIARSAFRPVASHGGAPATTQAGTARASAPPPATQDPRIARLSQLLEQVRQTTDPVQRVALIEELRRLRAEIR